MTKRTEEDRRGGQSEDCHIVSDALLVIRIIRGLIRAKSPFPTPIGLEASVIKVVADRRHRLCAGS